MLNFHKIFVVCFGRPGTNVIRKGFSAMDSEVVLTPVKLYAQVAYDYFPAT